MRVLFWSEIFWPSLGGAQILSVRLIHALRQRGYEFIVVTDRGRLDLPEKENYEGTTIYRFPFQAALTTGSIAQVAKTLQEIVKVKRAFKPDIIHICFTGPSVFFHLHTTSAHPAPCLYWVLGSLQSLISGQRDTLAGQAFGSADWVVACSQATLADVRRLTPGLAARSSIIYNAVESPDLPLRPLPVDVPRLMCVGRVVADKGFDLVLTAFASLAPRFPNAQLLIVGDGPARPSLEQQATDLGIAHAVRFAGLSTPENVWKWMNEATMVVVPSRHEGVPLVALEAASMARPVVASRVGGLAEFVVDRQTGLLVESEDSNALAEAIGILLKDQKTATQMGQAGRSRLQEMFGWDSFVDAFDSLYQTLLSKEVADVET